MQAQAAEYSGYAGSFRCFLVCLGDATLPNRRDALARGINQHAVEHLSDLWRALRTAGRSPETARFEVTDTIEKLGGAKPKSFEEFVRFSAQPIVEM